MTCPVPVGQGGLAETLAKRVGVIGMPAREALDLVYELRGMLGSAG